MYGDFKEGTGRGSHLSLVISAEQSRESQVVGRDTPARGPRGRGLHVGVSVMLLGPPNEAAVSPLSPGV